MSHDKTPSETPSKEGDPTYRRLGIIDHYKTPAGKRRLKRNQLRTIYALVQHQRERESFDGGEMQAAVRKWTRDEQLDLEDLLLKFQDPKNDLTIAVRESLQHQQLEDYVQALWEIITRRRTSLERTHRPGTSPTD